MKRILVPISILLVALVTWGLVKSQALLKVSSTTRVSVAAASLDFNLNVDENGTWEIDVGKVTPGDSGVVTVSINNVGTLSGTLCVERETIPPKFILQPAGTCEVVIEPGSSLRFDLEWSLPISAHNIGMDGTNFKFVINVRFENGFKVTKQVIITGIINDPVDTPTSTPTDTPTGTLTDTITPENPTSTDTSVLPMDGTATNTSTPTNSPSSIPTEGPTNTLLPTETPTDIPTIVPSETPLPPTETPTEVPTIVPTDTPLPPTETPVAIPTEPEIPTDAAP